MISSTGDFMDNTQKRLNWNEDWQKIVASRNSYQIIAREATPPAFPDYSAGSHSELLDPVWDGSVDPLRTSYWLLDSFIQQSEHYEQLELKFTTNYARGSLVDRHVHPDKTMKSAIETGMIGVWYAAKNGGISEQALVHVAYLEAVPNHRRRGSPAMVIRGDHAGKLIKVKKCVGESVQFLD